MIKKINELYVTIYTREAFDALAENDENADVATFCALQGVGLDSEGNFTYNNMMQYYEQNEFSLLAVNPDCDLDRAILSVIDNEYIDYLKANGLTHSSTEVVEYAMAQKPSKLKELFNKYNFNTNYLLYYFPIALSSFSKTTINTELDSATVKSLKSFISKFINNKDICIFNKLVNPQHAEMSASILSLAAKDYFDGSLENPADRLSVPSKETLRPNELVTLLIPIVIRVSNLQNVINLIDVRNSKRYIENYNKYLSNLDEQALSIIEDIPEVNDGDITKIFIDFANKKNKEQTEKAVLIRTNKYTGFYLDKLYIPTLNARKIFKNYNPNINKMFFPALSTPATVNEDIVSYMNEILDTLADLDDDDDDDYED